MVRGGYEEEVGFRKQIHRSLRKSQTAGNKFGLWNARDYLLLVEVLRAISYSKSDECIVPQTAQGLPKLCSIFTTNCTSPIPSSVAARAPATILP